MFKSKTNILAALLAASAICAGAAHASYPERSINIVVPFSAGGSTDIVARVLANGLTKALGQSVVVENKPGASGNIAGDYVARSKPDGYTLFMGTSTSIANIALFKKLPFDILKDFIPVSQIAHTPLVLVVNNSLPADDVSGLIELARKKPGELNYGSGGPGTSQHLGGVMFSTMAKVEMTHVPYKGAAPAMTDLIGGSIQMVFAPLIDALSFIRSGKVKALGLTTSKPAPQVPEIPLISKTLPGFEVATWNAIFVPAGTPAAVIDTLSRKIAEVMHSPEIRKSIEQQGSEAIGSTPADFKAFLDKEVILWKGLVESSGAAAN
ncbi:Bug family tripartite tricarboxylate transporter substrate binding protein [Pollutimonas bauzanensis]|uniref:Tripartite-type tricarboxylate transporter, receptor component TctC n=1 Tax=Pollutimonas bauzanensis TaxID=658167 RepID=A0A1M5VIN9_9BURK|nr:tripartite tricarboxylate transporter substrate binding protein [Pollutimonas bauzanensis]SHH75091.1 Tripartite-type tricarboxylate transporter, receptor component TctC [Pollutimonas bauzanensis]